MRYVRLYTDDTGGARFEDVEIALAPREPTIAVSERSAVSTIFFAQALPGRDRPRAPEPQRNWVICLTGSFQITASGETRTLRAGDVMLAEDVDGAGHATLTPDGYTVAVIPV